MACPEAGTVPRPMIEQSDPPCKPGVGDRGVVRALLDASRWQGIVVVVASAPDGPPQAESPLRRGRWRTSD